MRSQILTTKLLRALLYTGGTILLCITVYFFAKDYFKARKIDAEITGLQQELVTVQENNFKLAELIKYLDSDDYAEYKARIELGLVKPGESVVVFPQETQENKNLLAQKTDPTEQTNIGLWWDYFFGEKNKKQQ